MTLSINNITTRLGLLRSWSTRPTLTSQPLYSSTLVYTIWLQIVLKKFFRQKGCWIIDTYIAAIGDKYVIYVFYIRFPAVPLKKTSKSDRAKLLKSSHVNLSSLVRSPYFRFTQNKTTLVNRPGLVNPFSSPIRQSAIAWGEAAAVNVTKEFKSSSIYRAIVFPHERNTAQLQFNRRDLGRLMVFRVVFFKIISRHHVKSFGGYRVSIGSRKLINHHRRFLLNTPRLKPLTDHTAGRRARYIPNWKFSNLLSNVFVKKLIWKATQPSSSFNIQT